jgi:hypothetical protein
MQERVNMPTFLPRGDARPFVFKINLPVIGLVGAVSTCWPPVKPPGVAIGILIGLLPIFYFFNAGLVDPKPDYLLFRRFVRWRRIEYQEIIACGGSFFPGLNYLKLKTPERPFGKLYYIPYNPVDWVWQQPKADREAREYINARIGKSLDSLPAPPPVVPVKHEMFRGKKGVAQCAFSGTSSAVIVLLLRLLGWPWLDSPPTVGLGLKWADRIIADLWYLCVHVINWPYNLLATLSLLAVIFIIRFGRWSPSLASIVGAILGGTVAKLILAR